MAPTVIDAVATLLSDTRALFGLDQFGVAPASTVIVAVVIDVAVSGPSAPDGEHPQRFAIPPPPQNCGATQLVGQVTVVLHAVSVPHQVGSHWQPQRPIPVVAFTTQL